jgi:hypothetical protein
MLRLDLANNGLKEFFLSIYQVQKEIDEAMNVAPYHA